MLQTFTLCIKETEYVPTGNTCISGLPSLVQLTNLFHYRPSTEFSSFISYHISLYATAVAENAKFLTVQHTRVGPVPLKIIHSYYRNLKCWYSFNFCCT